MKREILRQILCAGVTHVTCKLLAESRFFFCFAICANFFLFPSSVLFFFIASIFSIYVYNLLSSLFFCVHLGSSFDLFRPQIILSPISTPNSCRTPTTNLHPLRSVVSSQRFSEDLSSSPRRRRRASSSLTPGDHRSRSDFPLRLPLPLATPRLAARGPHPFVRRSMWAASALPFIAAGLHVSAWGEGANS